MQYSLFQLLRVSDNSWQLILYQSVQVGWRDSTMMHVVIHISASVRLITSRYLWVFWPTCSRTLPPRKNGRVPSLPFFLGRRVLGARGVMRRVEFRLGTGYETPVQPRRMTSAHIWRVGVVVLGSRVFLLSFSYRRERSSRWSSAHSHHDSFSLLHSLETNWEFWPLNSNVEIFIEQAW